MAAQTGPGSQQEPACQLYHLTATRGNIRACADGGCRVIATVTDQDALCVRGLADNTNWFLIDPNPEDSDQTLYFISRDIVAPGPPGEVDPAQCDSYYVAVQEAVVRQYPTVTSAALGGLPQDTYVCAKQYGGQYKEWVYINYSDTGLVGWVFGSNLKAYKNQTSHPTGPTPTPDNSPRAQANTSVNVRVGDSTNFNIIGTLSTGTTVPITAASSTGSGWFQIRMPNGQLGWIAPNVVTVSGNVSSLPVIDPTGGQTIPQAGITPTPFTPVAGVFQTVSTTIPTSSPGISPGQTCQNYVVNVDAALVRTAPQDDAPVSATLSRNNLVCVLGPVQYLQNDWFIINLAPQGSVQQLGFMRQILLVPSQGPTLTPSPTATININASQPAPGSTLSPTLPTCPTSTPFAVNPFDLTLTPTTAPSPTATATSAASLTPSATPTATTGVVTKISSATPASGTPPARLTLTSAPTITATATTAASLTPTPPLNCLTATPTPIFTAQPTPITQGPLLARDMTFTQLSFRNQTLSSPHAQSQFRFTTPNNWQSDGNNILVLTFEYFQSAAAPQSGGSATASPHLSSTLQVTLDSQLVAQVNLDEKTIGSQTLTIPLPNNLLSNPDRRTHTISVVLDAQGYCQASLQSSALIRSDQSYIHFEYHETLPTLDLLKYPLPLFMNAIGNEIETVMIVLPPNPSMNDLRAALTISGGLGSLTGDGIQIKVVTADKLSVDDRRNNFLILVGQIGTNPLIDSLYAANLFPTHMGKDKRISASDLVVSPDDGITQIIQHPENPLRAIVAVTGQTPLAVSKAAFALSGPPPIMGVGGPLALVSDIRPPIKAPAQTVLNTTLTFKDLGITDTITTGLTGQFVDIPFFMPAGTTVTSDAYVDLQFTFSDILKDSQSTVTVQLNGTPIGSAFLSDSSAQSTPNPNVQVDTQASGGREIHHLRAIIPPDLVVPGETNTISVAVNPQNIWNCQPPADNVVWFTTLGDSQIFLPRQPIAPNLIKPVVGWFPIPFNTELDLHDVWISLPTHPTDQELNQAMQLISLLAANTAGGRGFTPQLSFGPLPGDVDTSKYNFIVLGRPTTNPFLAQLNPNLPQPFDTGTDRLQQVFDNVIVIQPPGFDMGVVESLKSPWSPDRVILVMTGTGPAGQNYAADVLLSGNYGRSALQGDVIFATGNTINVVDTTQYTNKTDLLTQTVLQATDEVIELSGTPTRNPAFTVTPGPSMTFTPSRTPQTATVTPLFTTTPSTPSPTVPTLAPTFTQLPGLDIAPDLPTAPGWVKILLLITGGVLGLTALYAMYKLALWWRRSRV